MNKSFRDLQDVWYEKLRKETDFKDIENIKHPNRPLLEWHSFKIPSAKFQLIKQNRSLYQRQIDDFLNHPFFIDACRSVIKHGNSKFTLEQTVLIWELHTRGYTTRETAKELNRAKSRIDDILKGLRQWMNLI